MITKKRFIIYFLMLCPLLLLHFIMSPGNADIPPGKADNVIHLLIPAKFKVQVGVDKFRKFVQLFGKGSNPVDLIRRNYPAESSDLKSGYGSFKIVFFNAVHKYRQWYALRLKTENPEVIYHLRIIPGAFENITIERISGGRTETLLSHYIPLWQYRLNTLQIDILDRHILVLQNKIPRFLIEKEKRGRLRAVEFNTNVTDQTRFLKQAKFAEISEQDAAELEELLKKSNTDPAALSRKE